MLRGIEGTPMIWLQLCILYTSRHATRLSNKLRLG